jgi:hypothetical protein
MSSLLQTSLEGRAIFRLAAKLSPRGNSVDYRAENYLGFVHRACIVILLRSYL